MNLLVDSASGRLSVGFIDEKLCLCSKALTDPVKLQTIGAFVLRTGEKDRGFLFLSQKLLFFLFL